MGDGAVASVNVLGGYCVSVKVSIKSRFTSGPGPFPPAFAPSPASEENSTDVSAEPLPKEPVASPAIDVSPTVSVIGVSAGLAVTVPGVARPSGPFRSFRLKN